jgi:bifunctional DNA-binding transcriptional regulator/antitoxin component of YhaV-PrlF toxin-antitoxin module
MELLASETGEIVIPGSLGQQLGIRGGDRIDASVEAGRIVITQPSIRRPGAGMIIDPRTGIPVLTGGEGAPQLTSEMVAEMLADFP